MSLFSNPKLDSLSFQKWKNTLSEIDEKRLEELCLTPDVTITQIHEFALELGYTHSLNSTARWFNILNIKEVNGIVNEIVTIEHNPKKGGIVQNFLDELAHEDSHNFMLHVEQPNVTVAELYAHLLTLGYKGTYETVGQWKRNFYPIGRRAAIINDIAKQCKGLDTDGILNKMITDVVKIADDISETINMESLDDKEKIRVLPSLYREAKGMIEAQNKIKFIRETHLIEQRTVMWMVEKLRHTFSEGTFADILDIALKGCIDEMISRQKSEKNG